MPAGWKAKLTEAGGGNRSLATCQAIAAHYGWSYSESGRSRARLHVDVVSPLARQAVVELLSNIDGVKLRKHERSVMSPIRVIITDAETGETSEKLKPRDSRAIVKQAAEIHERIKSAVKG